jgi:hypothetical protein
MPTRRVAPRREPKRNYVAHSKASLRSAGEATKTAHPRNRYGRQGAISDSLYLRSPTTPNESRRFAYSPEKPEEPEFSGGQGGDVADSGG